MKPFVADSLVLLLVQTLLIGLPVTAILAWFFDLRRDIRPVGGRDLNEIEEEERIRTTSLVKLGVLSIAVLSVTFIVGALRLSAGYGSDQRHRRIAIVPFDNRTSDVRLNGLGKAAAARVAMRLRPVPELEVVQERAAATAGVIVGGAYYVHGDSLRLGVQLTDAATGELLLYFAPPAVPRDGAFYFVPRLSKEVADTIARHFESRL